MTNNTDGAALLPVTQADRALGEELAALWAAVTAGDLSTAERHTESELVECPMCREGSIEATDYCNIDSKALGVQFYGIGPEHGAHERLWTAVISNFPEILAALTPSPLPATQEDAERSEIREAFAPCPTCRQYSHSIDDDALANAFMRFEAMLAHPVRGHPMGHIYDDATRDAAQVLVAAAKGASTPQRQGYDGEAVREALEDAFGAGWDARHPGAEFYGPRDKYVAAAVKALSAALAHPAQATPSAVSGDAGEEIEKLLTLIETAHEHANEIWIVEQAARVRAALPSHQGAGE